MGNLWLIGMMGSGKSTVGRHAARHLGLPFLDVDHLVEQIAGQAGHRGIPPGR